MKTKLKGKFSLLFLALAALLAIPAVALADNLKNDVQNTTGVGQQRDYTAGATATSVGYFIQRPVTVPKIRWRAATRQRIPLPP